MYHISFVHSSPGEYSDCSHFWLLWIMLLSTSGYKYLGISIWVPVFNSFGYIHRRWYFWMARAIQLGVKWHLTVVLISICLMTNVERLCMCFTGHLFTFPGEMSVQVLCPYLELGCLYFYCWVVGVLYTHTHTHTHKHTQIYIYTHVCVCILDVKVK